MTYERKLDAMLDDIFDRSDELNMSLTEMADASGLAYSTVFRINARITRLPRLKTVLDLAQAVHMDLILVAQKLKMRKGA